MNSLLELFCDVDDFCQVFVPVWRKQLLSAGEIQRQRERSLSLSEIMTILIHFHRVELRINGCGWIVMEETGQFEFVRRLGVDRAAGHGTLVTLAVQHVHFNDLFCVDLPALTRGKRVCIHQNEVA